MLALGVIALSSCGPALTTPSSTNISGTWVSAGPAAGMTNITVNLAQASDGSLTGTYTAIGTDPLQFCPATPPCAISDIITGTNTVLQVFFYMKDAGTFTGQILSDGTVKGAMTRISASDAVQFTRQ
jgi:hypothetical protein